MNRISRRQLLGAAIGAGLFDAAPAAGSSDDSYAGMPSDDEIFGWITDLWKMGDRSKYGFRMPGTQADLEAIQYIEDRFRSFGLKDVSREPMNVFVAYPEKWSLSIQPASGPVEQMPCYFIRYAAFTPPEGITAELVYVHQGSPADFAKQSVAGKIALVDWVAGPMEFPVTNQVSSVSEARLHGAVGLIAILTFRADGNNQMYHGPKYGNQVISGLTVSPDAGEKIKRMLSEGTVRATMVLTEEKSIWRNSFNGSWGLTYNIYGWIPGQTEETAILVTHHDGSATNEASGVGTLLALARFFGSTPPGTRRRTLLFFAHASHFGLAPPILESCKPIAAAKARTALVVDMEMIARQVDLVKGKYVPASAIAPWSFSVTNSNPKLLALMRDAVNRHKLEGAQIGKRMGGEGKLMQMAGFVPVIERIAANRPQYSSADTPATVMKEALRATACVLADVVTGSDAVPAAELRADG